MKSSDESSQRKEFMPFGLVSERWKRPPPPRPYRPMSRDVPFTSSSGPEPAGTMCSVLHRLQEKEKDLELAAKIGNSLLEQNKELQERNEFLEESLQQSNESVDQLKHQLKQRSSLFYVIADLDEEEDLGGSNRRTENSHTCTQKLETRLKSLENENRNLKGEASRLEDYNAALEKKERERVREYMGQLEKANLKIGRLQEQIMEKNKECALQAEDTEKLVKEIGQRKSKEKVLIDTNDELSTQLHTAVNNHETLKAEVASLQESYFDVMGMLRETEDELRGYRQRAALYRTSSADSLYDSLASELEASDSGCYNTPMFSARCESQQSSSQHQYAELQLGSQLCDLEPDPLISLEEEQVGDMESQMEQPDNEQQSSCSSFDVPTRALVNAVRSARDVRSLPDPVRSMGLRSDEEDAEKSVHADLFTDITPLAETMSFSTISFQSSISAKTVVPITSNLADPTSPLPPAVENVEIESKEEKTKKKTTPKVYRDMSTSPINFESINFPFDGSSNKTPKGENKFSRAGKESLRLSKCRAECSTAASCSSSSSSSSNETLCSVEKSNSSDSLGGYSAPKLGEPGRPGTRDLEFSIRRLNLRKQIEKNYQIFRKQRGLNPAKFYSTPFSNIPFNSRSVLDKEDSEEQLEAKQPPVSSISGKQAETYLIPSQWFPNNFDSPVSSLKPWVNQKRLQACWKNTLSSKHSALHPVCKDGVVSRKFEIDTFQRMPRSGSCSRLDDILGQLVEESFMQPEPLPHQQAMIMRPSLASLLLLKKQRPRRFPHLFPTGSNHTKAAVSRGSSPVADFAFPKNILGLSAIGGEQALTSSPGILQRFC